MSTDRPALPLRRRTFLELFGVAGASLLPLQVMGCADELAGPVSPGTFAVPPLLDGELRGSTRVFRLELRAGSVEWVTGAPTATYGVNGPYLGPTLRFRRGERVRIEVTNTLAETTTLHWHGVELPARSDGGPYQTIAAGATWVSEYDVIQRPMTAWYHPHQMHMTARHVYMGMAGFIFVEESAPDPTLPSTYGVDDLPLVIQDRRLFADGTHPYSQGNSPSMHDHMAGLRGEVMLVNGRPRPRGIVPRSLVRLRILNGSNARFYNLGFSDDRTFQHIASDGGLLDAPITTHRVLLAPGERAEVLVDFGADASGATVQLRSFSGEVFSSLFTGMMGANVTDNLDRATFEIMTFEVGTTRAAVTAPPTRFEPIARIAESEAARTRSIELSMRGPTVAINGAQMMQLDSVPAAINFQIRSGETEIWRVTNTSGMAHPLHIHNRHFQVLDIDGRPPPPPLAGWKDTVVIAPGRAVRLLLRFVGTADREYPYMFHCHILEHEDMGMMGQFYIVDP